MAAALPAALMIDLDGVVCMQGQLLPGVQRASELLHEIGLSRVFLTNDARYSRWDRAAELQECGLSVDPNDVLTASTVAALWLERTGKRRVGLLAAGSGREEYERFDLGFDGAEIVVVGDVFSDFHVGDLQAAYRSITEGAEFAALQSNRYYMTTSGPHIDTGFFIAGLAYCTGREPRLIGKPSRIAYEMAAESLGCKVADCVMVGDSVEVDLSGAAALGAGTVWIDQARTSDTEVELPKHCAVFGSLLEYLEHLRGVS